MSRIALAASIPNKSETPGTILFFTGGIAKQYVKRFSTPKIFNTLNGAD